MAQHTPGPWEARRNVQGDAIWVHREMRVDEPTARMVCIIDIQPLDGTDDANARLIAAAPDLLEALAALIEDIDSAKSLNEFIIGEKATRLESARDLVEKAQGGAK